MKLVFREVVKYLKFPKSGWEGDKVLARESGNRRRV